MKNTKNLNLELFEKEEVSVQSKSIESEATNKEIEEAKQIMKEVLNELDLFVL